MPSLRALLVPLLSAVSFSLAGDPLPGTQPLTAEGDLSAQMVEGIDRWLSQETQRMSKARTEQWTKLDVSSAEAWEKSLAPKRDLLRKMIGAVDARTPGVLEIITDGSAPVAKAEAASYTVERVRWPVFENVNGEGLLLRPSGPAKAAVIALPDADNTPEQFAGIAPGLAPEAQFARRLAEQGTLVVVMTLVDRRDNWSGSDKLKRFTNAPHREWIYRQSFESGRTLIGYEVQKVLAAMDALRGPSAKLLAEGAKIGVAGNGEGGLIALFSTAVDLRIEGALVAGYLQTDALWKEPIYRNLQGWLREFDATAMWLLTAPRVVMHHSRPPAVAGPPPVRDGRRGAAPGEIGETDVQRFEKAFRERLSALPKLAGASGPSFDTDTGKDGVPTGGPGAIGGTDLATPVDKLMAMLGVRTQPVQPGKVPAMQVAGEFLDARQRRAVRELEEFSQTVFRDAERTRKAQPLWTKLKPGAEWEAVQKAARADFWENVIGKLPGDYLKPNPRTRLVHDKEKWRSYEVMLDVQPDVFAWGVLLVPKDLKPGERRPVVVCQHGLEGVPEDTITQDKSERAWNYYKGFAAQLCERGFIVYAPHNPYRGQDKFRWLQRKANPLGLSLFSFIIAQHDVTTNWLASLPFVDPERIAFYGLSYGGKTAMRVPAALERYCLSICSGDFNEWVLKCVSNTHPASYIFTGEWEIWEWDLAHTFNYAEMALLIAPRPFMVERGHDDGVGLDEHVGYEFAKVKRGYDKLGIGERTEIEWFDGPHTIHGVGTFNFLHKWLRWPEPK
jgi:dienelactone hydrolase